MTVGRFRYEKTVYPDDSYLSKRNIPSSSTLLSVYADLFTVCGGGD